MNYGELKTLLPEDILIKIFERGGSKFIKKMRPVCKYFLEVGNSPLFRGITPEQRRIVDEACSRDSDHFMNIIRSAVGWIPTFPAAYTITCGTGTGKTLIGLFIMKRWVDEGHKVLLVLSPSHITSWTKEIDKWSEIYTLPKYKIFHKSYMGKDLSIPEDVSILIVSCFTKSTGDIYDAIVDNGSFTRCFTDESKKIPSFIKSYCINIDDFYGINLNATKGIVTGIRSKEKDEFLPDKPSLLTICTKTHKPIESYKRRIENNSSKRILVSYDTCFKDTFENEEYFIGNGMKLVERNEVLEKFMREGDEKRVLYAPTNFISKGHNIYPSFIYWFIGYFSFSSKTLNQLIGRAWRHGSKWKNVKVMIFCPKDMIPKVNTACAMYVEKCTNFNSKDLNFYVKGISRYLHCSTMEERRIYNRIRGEGRRMYGEMTFQMKD